MASKEKSKRQKEKSKDLSKEDQQEILVEKVNDQDEAVKYKDDIANLFFYFLIFISCANSLVIPFFPILASMDNLGYISIGFLLSMIAVGALGASFLFSRFYAEFTANTLLMMFLFANAISLFVVGLFSVFNNATLFVIFSIIFLLFLGFSVEMIQLTCFAVMAQYHADELEKKIERLEYGLGIGLIAGPILGALLYYAVDFLAITAIFLVFYVFAFLVLYQSLPTIPIHKALPKPAVVKGLLDSKSVMYSVGATFTVVFSAGYLIPALVLIFGNYGVSAEVSVMLYSLAAIVYCGVLLLLDWFVKDFNNKMYVSIGIGLSILGYLLIGPNPWALPQDLSLVIVGMCIIAAAAAFTLTPLLTIMIGDAEKEYSNVSKEALYEALSDYYWRSIVAGEIAGPLVGGLMIAWLGFPLATTILALAISIFLFVYLLVGGGISAIKEAAKSSEEKEEEGALLDEEQDEVDDMEMNKSKKNKTNKKEALDDSKVQKREKGKTLSSTRKDSDKLSQSSEEKAVVNVNLRDDENTVVIPDKGQGKKNKKRTK